MILVLSDLWQPFPGGAERLIFNIARELRLRGMDLRVVTGYARALRLDGPPLEIVDWPSTGADRDKGGAALTETLSLYSPRAILTHHHYAYAFEAELEASGVPVVQIVLNGRRLPCAALAVYISAWVRDTLGDARPGDLVVRPPAFDDVVAQTHGNAIGFIKPIPHKGIDLLYRIAAAMPERRFVVLRGEWQDLEVIRPARNVEFMEPVDDIRDFYAQCRLLLMPSRSEDAGTVAQEATLNGLPCISTNVGGLAETNGGGLRLPADDLRAWVGAIRGLDDPARYAQIVRSQQEHLRLLNGGALGDLAAAVAAL